MGSYVTKSPQKLAFFQKFLAKPLLYLRYFSWNNTLVHYLITLNSYISIIRHNFISIPLTWTFFSKTLFNNSKLRVIYLNNKKSLFKNSNPLKKRKFLRNFFNKVNTQPFNKVSLPNNGKSFFKNHTFFFRYRPLLRNKKLRLFTPYLRYSFKSLYNWTFDSPNFFFKKRRARYIKNKYSLNRSFLLNYKSLRSSLRLHKRRLSIEALIGSKGEYPITTYLLPFFKKKFNVRSYRSFLHKKLLKSKRKSIFKYRQLSFLNSKPRVLENRVIYKPFKLRVLKLYNKSFRRKRQFYRSPSNFIKSHKIKKWALSRFSRNSFNKARKINYNFFKSFRLLPKTLFRFNLDLKSSLKYINKSKRLALSDFRASTRKLRRKSFKKSLKNFFLKKRPSEIYLSHPKGVHNEVFLKKEIFFFNKKALHSSKYIHSIYFYYTNYYRIKNKPRNSKFKLSNRRLNLFKVFFLKNFISKLSYRLKYIRKSRKKFYSRRFNRSKKFLERYSKRFVDDFLETLPKKESKRQKALRKLFYETVYFRKRRRRITRKRFFFSPNFIKSRTFFNTKTPKRTNQALTTKDLYLNYLLTQNGIKPLKFNTFIPTPTGLKNTRPFKLKTFIRSRTLKSRLKGLKKLLRKNDPSRYSKSFMYSFLRRCSSRKTTLPYKFRPNKALSFGFSTYLYPNPAQLNYNFFNLQYLNNIYLNYINITTSFELVRGFIKPKFFTYFYSKLDLKRFNLNPFFNKSFSFLSIYSLHRRNFILSSNGFLFLGINYVKFSSKYFYRRSRVKSKIYKNQLSFFYKNDLKRIYLRRPGFTKVLSYFSRNRAIRRKYNRPTIYNTKISRLNFNAEYKNPFLLNQFLNSSIAKYRSKSFFINYNLSSVNTRVGSIRRIRFKPGYQRIWRRARSSLNFNLNFNFRYQFKLTRKITFLRRIKYSFSIWYMELSLYKILLNSRFIFDHKTSYELIDSGIVFINGILSSNPFMRLVVGDFIQLLVNIKYYITYRWLNSWRKFNRIKLIKLINHKRNSSRYDLSKQVSRHIPDWVFNYIFKNLDIPKYLEVDFFTLSSILLFHPTKVNQVNPLSLIEDRRKIYTMYNWKYIN